MDKVKFEVIMLSRDYAEYVQEHNPYEDCEDFCCQCSNKNREIVKMEDCFDRIRDNLEDLVDHLSREGDIDIFKINKSMLNMCYELGVKMRVMTVDRNSIYKNQMTKMV